MFLNLKGQRLPCPAPSLQGELFLGSLVQLFLPGASSNLSSYCLSPGLCPMHGRSSNWPFPSFLLLPFMGLTAHPSTSSYEVFPPSSLP